MFPDARAEGRWSRAGPRATLLAVVTPPAPPPRLALGACPERGPQSPQGQCRQVFNKLGWLGDRSGRPAGHHGGAAWSLYKKGIVPKVQEPELTPGMNPANSSLLSKQGSTVAVTLRKKGVSCRRLSNGFRPFHMEQKLETEELGSEHLQYSAIWRPQGDRGLSLGFSG